MTELAEPLAIEQEPIEPTTETQTELADPATDSESRVCIHCDQPAVCVYRPVEGGGSTRLCNYHAGVHHSSGNDLYVIGSDVPYEYVPVEKVLDEAIAICDDVINSQKAYTDPADEPTQPKPAPDSEEALRAYDLETIRLINGEAAEVKFFEQKYEELKAETADAKKEFEKAEKALRVLIEDRKNQRGKPQQPTLYRDPDEGTQPAPQAEADDDEQSDEEAEADAKELPPEQEPQPTGTGVFQGNHEFTAAELATPLSSLSLKQGLVNSLTEGALKDGGSCKPIQTVGDYFEWFKPLGNGYVRPLVDIKGIGPKGVETVEQAIHDFTVECCERKQRQQKAA